MTGPKIEDMTDEQIGEMTDEQLMDLGGESTASAPAADAGAEDGNADGEDDGNEGDAGNEGEQLTAEQLEALANEGQTVPLSRLNEVLARLERAESRLNEREQAALQQTEQEPEPEPEPQFDFKAKGRELIKAISEGDEDAAAALQDEIDTAREAQRIRDIAEAEERAVQRMNAARVRESTEAVVADVYERMPFLNNSSKDADVAAIAAVNAKAKAHVAAGKAPAEALRLAAEEIGPKFGEVAPAKGSAAVVNTDVKGAKPVAAGADPRTAASIRRNLQINQPQTGKTGVGNREAGATISVKDLTDEQLEAAEKDGTLDDLLMGKAD